MKTKQEKLGQYPTIELIINPEMSIKEFQESCISAFHAFPRIYNNGDECSDDTIFSELGIFESHTITVKTTGDVGDVIQAFEKIIKSKKINMFFFYEVRPWAVMLGDVKFKKTTILPSLIKSWAISVAMKLAIKYAN